MFSSVSQLLPPTSVECCVFATLSNQQYLVVGYRECIIFYSIQNGKLFVEFKTRIDGIPKGLATAKLNSKQYLVVQFDLSFSLCYVEHHTLKTASIHYYNREDIITAGIRHKMHNHHKILVDQQSTCILMPNMDFFTVLPIRNEMDDHDKIPYFPSWTMSYNDLKLVDVKNVVFLNGYFEPTIAVLQDGQPFWQGLNQTEQSFITVMSLNIQKKQFTPLKSYKSLPSTSQFILAIPAQTGFVYFCASGFFIYDKTSTNGFGVGVSAYSSLETNKYIDKLDLLGMSLDGCQAQFISNDVFLLILQNGQVWTVKILPSTRLLKGRVDIVANSPISANGIRVIFNKISNTTMSIVKDICISVPYCFVGCCGHSKLLDLKLEAPEPMVLEDIADDDLYQTAPVVKAPAVIVPSASGSNIAADKDITVLDTLQSFAPIRHIATNNNTDANKLMLVAATGTYNESCITIFQQTLPWHVIHTIGTRLLKVIPVVINMHPAFQIQKDNKVYLQQLSPSLRTTGNPHQIDLKSLFYFQSPLFSVSISSTCFIIHDLSLYKQLTHTHNIQIGHCQLFNQYLTNVHKSKFYLFKIDANLHNIDLLMTINHVIDAHVSITIDDTVDNDAMSMESGQVDEIINIWLLLEGDVVQMLDINGDIQCEFECHGFNHTIINTHTDMKQDENVPKTTLNNLAVLYRLCNDKPCWYILLGDANGLGCYRYIPTEHYLVRIALPILKIKYYRHAFYTTSSMMDQCFILGNKTLLFQISERGNLFMHELAQLHFIKYIAKFEQILNTFIITDDLNTTLLIEIPNEMNRDCELLYRQIPTNATSTVDKIALHDASGLVVALSYDRIMTKCPPPLVHNDETDGRKVTASLITDLTTELENKPGAFQVEMSKYKLDLMNIKHTKDCVIDQVEFDDYFIILDMASLVIETKESLTGTKEYIAVSGGLMKGEETQIKGEIHVFDIIKINLDVTKPHVTHKLKHRAKTSFKGVASSLTSVVGHLLTTNGFKVMVYKFDGNKLNAIAFYDLHHMVSCVAAIKNYVLATDVYRSATFLAFQEDPYRFFLLGRDYMNLEIEQCNFLIDGNSLGLVELDKYGNLYISSFSPFDIQSASGNKLLRVADYHLGAQASKLIRIRKAQMDGKASRQFFNILSFYDGGLSCVSPIGERTFKRMLFITARMYQTVPHACGLNPRTYRLSTNTIARLDENPHKNVIDGDFAKEFVYLNQAAQEAMCESIGITKDRYLTDLQMIRDDVGRF